jgi:amino acid adenylation domain-containing protein
MPGITDVAGPVLTTVPVRMTVNNKLPVIQYLHDVRQMAATMIPHQHSGLQRIQKLSSDAALACNFQNLLVIQSNDVQLSDDIWRPENFEVRSDFLTHPLVVECTLSRSDLVIQAYHDEVALDIWHAKRLAEQFSFVLEQLINVPQESSITVGDIDVASPLDKREIALWNQRQVQCVDRCSHDIISEQALRQPHAPAICSWDGDLTYHEMLGLAFPFARYLVSCGVGPETFVPVCLDKSLWAMVAILSVLLAGGAFVPLDPSHPTSRHKEILAEVDADIILCSPQHRSRYLGSVSTIIPVSEETIKAYGAIKSSTKPHTNATPSNMAYAIFTSGSTGRPKGIVIEHRSVCSSVLAFAPVKDLGANSRVFQFASLTFDAAILEVLGTLMLGGCICVPSEDERLNDISGAMQRMMVSWTFLTPSVASIIEPSSVPSLKVLSLGGEKLSREVVAKWANHVKLFGGYGPTETVIFAVVNSDFVNHHAACIGYGIPCTLTWIVDPEDHNRLTPLGAIGELALEGPALAREYLKNPNKNAEAFINEPAWVKNFPSTLPSPRRIYKTGDLVKYNTDGSVEYLGRKDHQVKLHGQRMELGEIEHRLLDSPNVRHALVILPQTGCLKQKLVGILSLNSLASESGLNSGGTLELLSPKDMARVGQREISAIQKSIEEQLPIYMVPQAWVVVKNVPMLVSGKLDRKRVTHWIDHLEESAYNRIMQDYEDVTPDTVEQEDHDNANSTVEIIRDIFAQVLNLPLHKVDPSRSFINLGGDSITGMAVVSKARKSGLNLPLNRVLQSKSIESLSLCCEAKSPEAQKAKESTVSFRLSPIQELFFRASPTAPKSSGRFNQSITVQLTRKIQPSVLKNAVHALVQKHSMFRARFSKSADGTWQQRITDVSTIPSTSWGQS